jgi:hypothetical protein
VDVTRQAWARLAAYAAVVTAGAWGFWIDHQQDRARCEARNEAIRTAVLVGADSLVAQASDADQQRIDDYLSDLNRRLKAVEVDCT